MRSLLFAAFAALLATGAVAHADPVTYTLTGTFTGTIGALSFTSDPGSIVQMTDTSATTTPGGGFYLNTGGTTTITLGGLGTAIFLTPSFGAYGSTDTAGFYDLNNGFGVNDYDPCLGQTDCANNYDPTVGDYALTYPFTDTGFLEESFAASFGTTELTSLGDLMISGDAGTSATFTASATVPTNPVSTTPEPSSLALLGTGLLGVVGTARRRFAAR